MSGFGTVNCCHNVLANFIRHLLKFKIVHDVSFYHLYLCSSLKRPKQGHLVNIFQIASYGNSARDSCHFDAGRLDELADIHGRSLALQLELVAIMTSSTSFSRRTMSSLRRISAGPMPSMGEIAPPST